jgi:hypothetical protein
MTTSTPEDGTIGSETLTDAEALELLQEEIKQAFPPEALGIAWCDMYGTAVDKKSGEQKIVKISLTSRSSVGPRAALTTLMDTIRYAKDTYHLTPYLPSFQSTPAPAKTPQEAPEQAATSANPNPAAKPATVAAPDAVSTPSGGASEKVYHCTRMEVVPMPDDRATLKFFEPNPPNKYPVLSITNWPTTNIVKLLAETGAWEESMLAKAQNFTVNYMVFYELSEKTTAKGNPYKNVTRIELVK